MIAEFSLFLFTLLGGAAAGLYVAVAAFPPESDEDRPWLVAAIAMGLLAVGGVALLLHLGRPERVLLAFSNPAAGIAQEGYATVVFGALVVVDLAIALLKKAPVRMVRVLAAVAGIALCVVMGGAYYAYSAQGAWSTWQTFPLFVVGALALGSSVAGFLSGNYYGSPMRRAYAGAAYALFAVTAILEAFHFASMGYDIALHVVGAVLSVAAAILALSKAGGLQGEPRSRVVFALVLVGVALSRYGFYLAYAG